MSIHQRLKKIFQEALELPKEMEVESLGYRIVPQWDSVGHMRLVAALESEFDILLTTDEILDLSTFKRGLEILSSHGVVD